MFKSSCEMERLLRDEIGKGMCVCEVVCSWREGRDRGREKEKGTVRGGNGVATSCSGRLTLLSDLSLMTLRSAGTRRCEERALM